MKSNLKNNKLTKTEITFKPKRKLCPISMHVVKYAKYSQLSKGNVKEKVKLLCDLL